MLDISRQLACMKLGSRGKYQPMQYLLGSYKPVARLPSSYIPVAYRYPTNILQYPDWTAFALAALMLPSLGTATYTYLNVCTYSCSPNIAGGASIFCTSGHTVCRESCDSYTYTKQAIKKLRFHITCILLYVESNHERVSVKKTEVGTQVYVGTHTCHWIGGH